MGSVLRLCSHTSTKTNPAAQDSHRLKKMQFILTGRDDSGLISSGSLAFLCNLIMMIGSSSNYWFFCGTVKLRRGRKKGEGLEKPILFGFVIVPHWIIM